jgi:hypothetical protein
VRNSIARVISVIAKTEVPAGRWNELLAFLYGCCQSQVAAQREVCDFGLKSDLFQVGFYVIFALLEALPDSMTQHTAHLLQLFSAGLNDPESAQVKLTALQYALNIFEVFMIKGDWVLWPS